MSEKQELLSELRVIYDGEAWHANNLSEILAGISHEQAAAKPIPAAHSIWELVLHIAGWNETFAARLEGKNQLEPVDGDFPAVAERSPRAWQAALERLRRSHEKMLEVFAKQAESNFANQFDDRDYTLSFFLHGTVRHIVYHSAQIAILKKA